jgi:two-component system response regulator HupR/HoxA
MRQSYYQNDKDASPPSHKPHVAIVDDDALIVESFDDEFSEDFVISGFTSPLEALNAPLLKQVSVVIADFRMPELDGITFLTRVMEARPTVSRILFTAYADLDCLSRAINQAAIFHYISKDALGRPKSHSEIANIVLRGVDLTNLREERNELLRRLTEREQALREENDLLKQHCPRVLGAAYFSDLIGNSPSLLEVVRRARDAARQDFVVLVYGETGTGKDILSRAIHFEGARRNRRFVAINCAAIQKDLITSELMGYTRGAFTGAADNKAGVLEAADKGTVFLDEIGDLPLDAQAHLLRFLESGEVRPIGSSVAKQVDVRIIAATHRDLRVETEAGRFREDLYYRLATGIELRLPPLRNRVDDIPLLVSHILEKRGRQTRFDISLEAIAYLQTQEFRGNIRELAGILQKAITELILSGGNTVLPVHFRPNTFLGMANPDVHDWKAKLNQSKVVEIRRALDQHKTIKEAAAHLGLSREGLSRLMSSLGIKNPAGR